MAVTFEKIFVDLNTPEAAAILEIAMEAEAAFKKAVADRRALTTASFSDFTGEATNSDANAAEQLHFE